MTQGADDFAAVLGYWQDSDPMEAVATARLVDGLGYRELWVGEMATFDAFALAGALGAQTDHVELTVGPLAVGVRDPMAMAMGTASVAALSGRRANLAIGASSPVVVSAWHGREYARTATHIAEAAQAVRPILAGEKSAFDGELARTHGYRLRLDPPGASLTIAAFGDAAVRAAARHADRMVINLATVQGAAGLRERLDAAAAAAGRPAPPLALWVVAAVDPTDAGIEQMTRSVVPYLAAPGYAEMFASAGFGDLVTLARTGLHPRELLAEVPRDLCRAIGLVGTEAEIRERAAAYRAAGVDELAIAPTTAGDPAGERTLSALAPVHSHRE
jgi:probable F420-dependent oxidoreductase